MTTKTNKLSTKRRRNTKFGILLIIIIAACAIGGTAFALSIADEPKTEVAEEEIAEESSPEEESEPEETVLETEEDKTSASLNGVTQNEGENPNTLAELTGSLTYAEKSGENLVLRVNIDQSLTSGTCQLTLSNSKATVYTAEAPIFSTGSANASCEGFDIPLSDLPSGSLSLNIKLISGTKTGVITGEVAP